MSIALSDVAAGLASSDFRLRLLTGLAHSIAERGYRETTVADVVRQAKTSKRTFYDQFASKEECFIALLRSNNERMIEQIRAAVDPESEPGVQVDAALTAYVEHIASEPSLTLSWIREAPALGESAQSLHRLAMKHFTDLLVDISTSAGFARAGLQPVSRELALILLGGLRELTASLVENGGDVRTMLAPSASATRALLGLLPRP